MNNPSHEILLDIKRKLRATNTVIDVFVSFGTGVTTSSSQGSLTKWSRLLSEVKKEMTDVVRAHEAMIHECGLGNENKKTKKAFEYFRFEGGKDLGDVKMDSWSGRRKAQFYLRHRPTGEETLIKMTEAVKKYVKTKEVKDEMEALANLLVSRRRLRTRDKSAWERYACASHYECNQDGCDTRVETLDKFEAHLRSTHNELSEDDRQSSVEVSRRCWTYRAGKAEWS